MKNFRYIAVLVLLTALMAALAGCGTGSQNTASTITGGGISSGVTGDTLKLSLFAGSIPENTPSGGAIKAMEAYINDNSDETLIAQAFYDTSLGDATFMIQGLQLGTIDIGVSGTSYYSGLVPEVDVYQLPFLFDSLESARAATEGPSKDVIFQKLSAYGIIGLTFFENGFRELSNNVRPIKTPDDMKGIKMRTLPAEIQVETWRLMGALPATIDSSELYTALQQGAVNAQDNPLHEIASRKFYEVQPYVTMTDAVYTPFLMSVSEITWNKLSDSQKQVIRDAADIALHEQLKLTDEAQTAAKQILIDNGVVIEENPDKEAFKEKAMQTWSLFTDKYGTELVDMIQER